MFKGKNGLLKAGLLLLAVGSVIFFHPFHTQPMWMEWIVGPVLFYLGLPLAILGIVVHTVGTGQKPGEVLSQSKPRA